MKTYAIAIGGGGAWVTGMWENIVGYVKRDKNWWGVEKRGKQIIE